MGPPPPVWVIDTSSIAEIRRSVENRFKEGVFRQASALVAAGRLVYPKQVVAELKRHADPERPDRQYSWADENAVTACSSQPSWEAVQEILAVVPQVLDPNKDSGEEEADAYVLAQAQSLRRRLQDVRVVTEERKDMPSKMSLNTAAGVLGIPSVPLRGFLHAEGIIAFSPEDSET